MVAYRLGFLLLFFFLESFWQYVACFEMYIWIAENTF